MLYQLSYEGTHWERGQFIEFISPVRSEMCGFIAQLVEHHTGVAEVTGSNPLEVLIFLGFFFSVALIGKFTAMIIPHFHLHRSLNMNNAI